MRPAGKARPAFAKASARPPKFPAARVPANDGESIHDPAPSARGREGVQEVLADETRLGLANATSKSPLDTVAAVAARPSTGCLLWQFSVKRVLARVPIAHRNAPRDD